MKTWTMVLVTTLSLAGAGCAQVEVVPEKKVDVRRAPPKARPAQAQQKPVPPVEPEQPMEKHPRLSTSPDGLMLPEGGAMIQRALAKRGYLQGHDTGTLDDETAAALRKFQGDQHLARTGAPDRDTLRALDLSPDTVFRPPARDAGL
jgi:hypothetical protein